MKELETGVFDLESPIPFNFTQEQTTQLLVIYGTGIEQGIASVILGYSGRYKKWVGVTLSKILSVITSFDANRHNIKPTEKDKIMALGIETAVKLKAALQNPANQKSFNRTKHGDHDEIISLVVREDTTPFSAN